MQLMTTNDRVRATQAVARSDGIPLFAEQLARTFSRRPADADPAAYQVLDLESAETWTKWGLGRTQLAFAAAIMARRTGQARWWIASGLGAMVTMQCHVLGVVIMAPLRW